MVKNHLKKLAAPKTWNIRRKSTTFITKPSPGPHSLQNGLPLSVFLKYNLDYAKTTKDVKKILNTNEVKVDGVSRKDIRFPIGIFDTLEFTEIKESYRLVLTKKGKIGFVNIKKDESSSKPCKIIGKTAVKRKIQLNLYDGKNILVNEGEYKVGDTLLISVPDHKITKHLKLEKKATIFLIGGRHIGSIGHVEDIIQNKIIYKDENGNMIETLKKYAYVVGDTHPLITLK
jgi:small subunit ribosomal protein S4e